MLRLDLDDGRSIGAVQIAGLVARRIVCYLEEGQTSSREGSAWAHTLRQQG